METDLNGRWVLITGASGGIGQATARAFAAEGAGLLLHAHRHVAEAERLRAELAADATHPAVDAPHPAVDAAVLAADLRDERAVEELFAAAVRRAGRIDAVVVNAGVWRTEDVPLHRLTAAQWRETLDADLTSAFLTCRAFLRHLEESPRERASVVLVASTAALFGEAGHADYAAAKAGLAYGLTLSLKNEIVRLAPRGRVNCVCPGWTATPMAAGPLADPAVLRRVTATRPLRGVAQPEDVAAAVVFLTSDRLAGHLSGTILPVAGGMEGRLLHPP